MDLQQENELLRRENDGLKRIMRERANAARELRPKKDHPGFVVLRATQEWGPLPNTPNGKKQLWWRSIVQFPYPAGLTYDEVVALWADGGKDQLEAALGVKIIPWGSMAEVLWDRDASAKFWSAKICSVQYPAVKP